MSTMLRYFRSQRYVADEEMSEARAREQETYVRVTFAGERPERAEVLMTGKLHSVVYYDHDVTDRELVDRHHRLYGAVPMTIYGRPAPVPEGEMQTLSEFDRTGRLIQITRRLVDRSDEPLREEIVDADGAPVGVRRFEYEGSYLARVVFERADGAEIVELED